MRIAVVAICIGEKYNSISKLTHPTLKKYSDRIGAEFIVIDKCKTSPYWEKFRLYDLLNTYDRILYLDTDLIVRDDCPNLFKIVPYNQIGAVDEMKHTQREYSLTKTAEAYGIDPSKLNWNGKYYNTGVMLFSKCHKNLLKRPEKEFSSFYEQGCLNFIISQEESHRGKEDTPLMYDLPYSFNRIECYDSCALVKYESYIIHYAGYHYFTKLNEIKKVIQNDLERWEKDSPDYNYKIKKGYGVEYDNKRKTEIMTPEDMVDKSDNKFIIFPHLF